MTFDELVQQTAADKEVDHPDDIAFLREELLIGWNAAWSEAIARYCPPPCPHCGSTSYTPGGGYHDCCGQ